MTRMRAPRIALPARVLSASASAWTTSLGMARFTSPASSTKRASMSKARARQDR